MYLQSVHVEAVWTYPTNRALPLKGKVAVILKEQQKTTASQTVNSDSGQILGSPKEGKYITNFGNHYDNHEPPANVIDR